MPSYIVVRQCIAEAEKRVDAMQVLLEILTGQVKGERRQLDELKAAIASDNGQAAQGEISPEMLGGWEPGRATNTGAGGSELVCR